MNQLAARSLRRTPSKLPAPRPRRLVAALAAGSVLAALPLAAWPAANLPTGMNVVAGQAQASLNGNTLTVRNSPNAILNWNSFSIGAGNAVRFDQVNAASQVLNRVTGTDPSAILGSLSSNGRVWLLNPNGVLFGQGARVDVAGLVTSTLNLNDNDWLAGRYVLSRGNATQASIVNEGELRTSLGGRIALLSGSVVNKGSVDAPGGQVLVATGDAIELIDTGAPNVGVRIAAAAGDVVNLGALSAAGGKVDVYAASINQHGVVRADSLERGPAGEIVLRATEDLMVDGAVTARGADGQGGRVTLLGRRIGLLSGASLDVSGAQGGGHAYVGGGEQGKDASLPNAEAVYIAPQASLAADAGERGDGGRLIVWSDRATRAFGQFSAHGGALGGNGGFIETSGGWLDARPARMNLSAPYGASGTWLLDPFNILISNAVSTFNMDASFTAIGDSATLAAADIASALSAGTNVTISTGGASGTQEGNITLSGATINVGVANPGSLTLIADGGISSSTVTISSSNGPMAVSFYAGRAGNGNISLTNTNITSQGGAILLGGFRARSDATGSFNGAAGWDDAPDGISVVNTTLSAGSGSLSLFGTSNSTSSGSRGVFIGSGTSLSGRDVTIRGVSDAGSGAEFNGATVLGTHQLLTRGRGAVFGIHTSNSSRLHVLPSGPDASALLDLNGDSTTQTHGIFLDGTSGSFNTLQANNSAAVNVLAGNVPGSSAALEIFGIGAAVLNASGGGAVTIATAGSGLEIDVQNQQLTGSSQAFTLKAPGGKVNLTSSTVSAGGKIGVFGDDIALGGSAVITSTAPGEAIVVAGSASTHLQTFNNSAGSGALLAANGRWIVYGADVTDGSSFQPGALPYNFKRYGAAFNDWAFDTGNGFAYAADQTANFTANVQNRPYNGTTGATVLGGSVIGVLSDTGTLNGSATATFADKNAGVGKTVTFDPFVEPFNMVDSNSKPVFGYTFVGSMSGDISKTVISANVTGDNKVYDATTAATVKVGAISGLVGSETVIVTGSGTFTDKNVGNAKPISAGYSIADGANGGLAGNYQFTPLGGSVVADITPAPLLITGLSGADKVYDATTVATLSGSPSISPLGADVVNLSGTASASFVDKNVGVNKPISVSGLSISGADAGNYSLQSVGSVQASITKAPLLLNGLSGLDKVYDATVAAFVSGSASVSPLGSDSVGLSGSPTAVFADKNVGLDKPITVTGLTLTGPDAGNYDLAMPGSLTADITKAALLLQNVTANNKVYDAKLVATLGGAASVTALGSDVVSVDSSGAQGFFADKNVGSAKPVTISGYALTGTDAGNYTLSFPTLQADITVAQLALQGLVVNDKVYDTTTSAVLTGSPFITPLNTDQVTLNGTASIAFLDKNVGQNKPISLSGLSISGPDAGNYVLAPSGVSTASITPAPLLVTGITARDKVYDATRAAQFTGTPGITPLGSDQVALSGTLSGQFDTKNAGQNKAVEVTGGQLTGPDAGNYMLVSSGLHANVIQAPLTAIGLSALDKPYDGTVTVQFSGQATVTPIGGDIVSISGTPFGAFSDKNVGLDKNVSIGGLVLAGADAGNYVLSIPTLRADITALALVVNGLTAASKVYDATTAAQLSGTMQFASLPGDQITVTGTPIGSFVDKNVGQDKQIVLSGLTLSGPDAGNYAVQPGQSLKASITPAPLQVTGLSAGTRVYDTTTAVTLIGSPTIAPLGQDQLSLNGTLTASFVDKNAGVNKPVQLSALTLGGTDAGNYTLVQPVVRGTVTPAPLLITGLTANDKVYDAGLTTTLSGQGSATPLGQDQITITGTGVGTFADKNVGSRKPVTAGGLAFGGVDGGNYTPTYQSGLFASITPATLRYVADQVTVFTNEPLPSLTGTVAGFFGGDNLANSTTGTLSFSLVGEGGAEQIGRYAVMGGGLQASNYVFVQDPSNSTALFVSGPRPPTNLAQDATQMIGPMLDALTASQQASPSKLSAGLLDTTQPPTTAEAAPGAVQASAFGVVNVGSLSQDGLAAILAARDRYKKNLFAEADARLTKDPKLADVGACQRIADAQAGTCLITESMKARMQAEALTLELPAGAEATPAPVAAAPSAATAPKLAQAPAAPARATPLSVKRRVKVAALPQIERKIAVFVGVDRYADQAIPQLNNPVSDARAIATLFENNLGYETVVIENANKQAVVTALNKLALEMSPKDSVVIYYAGHGELIEATGQGYWQLSDSDSKRPETWLSNADIGRAISLIGAGQVALISDSCYSGSLVSDERVRLASGKADPNQVLERKSVVVMSSGGNEPVSDEGKDGHSPFAWNLMNQLKNVSNWQLGGNVFERVRFAVAREMPQRPRYGAASSAGHQTGGDYLFEQRQLEARPKP